MLKLKSLLSRRVKDGQGQDELTATGPATLRAVATLGQPVNALMAAGIAGHPCTIVTEVRPRPATIAARRRDPVTGRFLRRDA